MSTSIVSNDPSSVSPFRPPDSRVLAGNCGKVSSDVSNEKPKSLDVPTTSRMDRIPSPMENPVQEVNKVTTKNNLQENKNNNDVPKLVLETDEDIERFGNNGGSETQLIGERYLNLENLHYCKIQLKF